MTPHPPQGERQRRHAGFSLRRAGLAGAEVSFDGGGISLASKYLILFYLFRLAIGVAATPLRRALANRWIYFGAAFALAM